MALNEGDFIEDLFKKEFEKKPKEELLKEAIELGLRTERIVCPLCLMNRVSEKTSEKSRRKGKYGKIHFDRGDIDSIEGRFFLQVAYAIPNKGFFVNPEESKTFREFVRDERYGDFVKEIYEKCKNIIRIIEEEKPSYK